MQFSRDLEETLHRSVALASDRKHEFAALEHLLCAITKDPDAREVLDGCGVNPEELERVCTRYLDEELNSLVVDDDEDPKPTAGFQRVIQRAVIHTESRRETDGDKDAEVTGANVLLALFSERESHAAYFLQEQGITRYDVVDYMYNEKRIERQANSIIKNIESSSRYSPNFSSKRNLVVYIPKKPRSDFLRRKNEALYRCEELNSYCQDRLLNSHRELSLLVSKYFEKLVSTTAKSGPFSLLLAGLDIENHLNIKAALPPNEDENVPLSTDARSKIASLMIAHAALMSLFPEASEITTEIDRYQELSRDTSFVSKDLLNPVLHHLTNSPNILHKDTAEITEKISQHDENSETLVRGNVSVKHNWARGILSFIGRHIIEQIKGIAKAGRDALTKEGVTEALKHSDKLTASILNFFTSNKDILLSLSENLRASFGWISSLISMII